MAGINWGMAAGGAQDAMQQMLEQRILEEKMALAQRQQQAEEQYRAAQLQEQAAGRGDTNTRFNSELNWNKEKFGAEAPKREADVADTLVQTEGRRLDNVGKGQTNAEQARIIGLRPAAEARIAGRPGGQAVLDAGHAGVTSKGVDPNDLDGAVNRTFVADENKKARGASVQSAGIRAASSGGVSGTESARQMGQIQRRYEAATKDYRTVRQAVSMMDAAVAELDAKGMNDPAGQAIMVKFQNTLDPNSVVREGEYARTAEGQPLFDRLQVAFSRLQTGGPAVKVAALKDYVNLSHKFLEQQRAWAGTQRDLAGRQADYVGIPRDLVFAADADLDGPAQQAAPAGGKKFTITKVQ